MTSRTRRDPDSSDRRRGRNDRGDGGGKAAWTPPARERRDQSAIAAFSEEGAGIAAKE